MLGGFFEGGGISYFGNSVSVAPEDVCCYTYAVPLTINDGADKATELTVPKAAATNSDAASSPKTGDAGKALPLTVLAVSVFTAFCLRKKDSGAIVDDFSSCFYSY